MFCGIIDAREFNHLHWIKSNWILFAEPFWMRQTHTFVYTYMICMISTRNICDVKFFISVVRRRSKIKHNSLEVEIFVAKENGMFWIFNCGCHYFGYFIASLVCKQCLSLFLCLFLWKNIYAVFILVFSLKCWVCDSKADSKCGDPFISTMNTTIYYVACNPNDDKESVACVKTVAECKTKICNFFRKKIWNKNFTELILFNSFSYNE